MTTLQEYLNQKYPTREDKERVKRIDIDDINEERKVQGIITEKLAGGALDLSEYMNVEGVNVDGYCLSLKLTKLILGNKPKLTGLSCPRNQLTSLDLSNYPNLVALSCYNNQFSSVDFLNSLPNPKKLK